MAGVQRKTGDYRQENGESVHEKSKTYEQLAFSCCVVRRRHMTPVAKSLLHSLISGQNVKLPDLVNCREYAVFGFPLLL
jgi:hypothetical protein